MPQAVPRAVLARLEQQVLLELPVPLEPAGAAEVESLREERPVLARMDRQPPD